MTTILNAIHFFLKCTPRIDGEPIVVSGHIRDYGMLDVLKMYASGIHVGLVMYPTLTVAIGKERNVAGLIAYWKGTRASMRGEYRYTMKEIRNQYLWYPEEEMFISEEDLNQIRHTVANHFPEFRVFRNRTILPHEPEVLLVSPSPSGGTLGGVLP